MYTASAFFSVRWPLLAALAFAAVGLGLAQIGGGSIVGNVTDPSGAPAPNVHVTVQNQETNEIREATTNNDGYYEFPLLPPGHYRLSAEGQGFEKIRGEVFELSAGTRPRIDLKLKIGSVNQTVDVSASAPLINTTTTDLGVVMSRQRTDQLPLNGRNFQDLVNLQAGVVSSPSNSAGGRGGISFNGSTALGTNILLDGVDMTFGEVNGTASFQSAGGGTTLINGVSLEAIEEFKSTASAFSAEYGRAGGGVLNIVTRSGSNTFHGTLFEFFRNDALDANDFFSNKSGLSKSPLRWNQFGGNLGGPIRKDKLFFFFNYEGAQVKRQAQITGNVPTPALLNALPQSISTVLSQYMPDTYTPTSSPYVGLHRRDDQQVNDEHTFLGKVDALLGSHRLSVRYSYNHQTYTSPTLEPTMPTVYPLRFHNAVVEDTTNIGANAFNELRLGINRVDLDRNPQGYENVPAYVTIQSVSFSQSNFIHFVPTTYSLADNFSLIRGAHSMKMGIDLREVRSVRIQGGPPSYSYNTYALGIAGEPATVGLSFTTSKGLRTMNQGFYFQDDWHISNTFQANLGVRYEYSPPLRGGFNVDSSNPFGPFNAAQAPMFAPDRNDFAPRIGLVWHPWQRTVIRSGGGISYVMPQAIFYYDMAYINPLLSGVSSVSAADIPASYLVYPNILPFQTAIEQNPALLPSDIHLSRSVADYNRRDTYVGMWNFVVQQELRKNLALQVAYVGQRTDKLISVRPLNLVDPATGERPIPTLGQVNFEENAANITYNALEVSLNQRLWKGLSYEVYLTWSGTKGYYTPDDTITFTGSGLQDPNNIAGSAGPLEGLPKKILKGVFSYEIPGGHFDRRLLRGALSGWTLTGILGWRSGIPMNVVSGNDYVGNGRAAGQRPDAVAGVDPYVEDHDTQVWLTPAAFSIAAVQAEQRFGNLGFYALLGPSAFSLDSGLHKTFNLTEKQHLTFRLEAFNTLNHTAFNNPNTTLNNPNFGIITGAASPRAYQLALKYVF
ncbi:MAG TPA: TonB-dependent receptor [Bryobacteraceae bacterium]|nr:TonB-dependent receptor [Bryobacteraceae bacterium]